MTDEPHPEDGRGGDDEFDRIVAGLELSMPDDLEEPLEQPAAPDVFDPRMSDPLEEDTDEDDDRYVPPPPEPHPPMDALSRIAWSALVGVPLVLLLAVILAWPIPQVITGVLVLGFVAALVLLLMRRGNDNRGDDPDQGAVL